MDHTAVRAAVRAAPWPQRVGSCAQVGSRSARARERDGKGGGGERCAGTWRAVQFVQQVHGRARGLFRAQTLGDGLGHRAPVAACMAASSGHSFTAGTRNIPRLQWEKIVSVNQHQPERICPIYGTVYVPCVSVARRCARLVARARRPRRGAAPRAGLSAAIPRVCPAPAAARARRGFFILH